VLYPVEVVLTESNSEESYRALLSQRGGPKLKLRDALRTPSLLKAKRVDFSELDSSKTNATALTTKDIISLGNRMPEYPSEAIRNKISGVVKVSIEIDDLGKVKDSKVGSTSGARILDLSALEASKDWTFPKEYYSKNFDVDIEYILKD
jgi:TonB family protein